MGKAWQPPKTTMDFRFFITAHAERIAKARRVTAERELETALSEIDVATAHVEKLMAKLQEQRS